MLKKLDKKEATGFGADIHFRAPGDLMARVHAVARRQGMTASNFMRRAIIEAVERQKGQDATQEKHA